MITKKIIFGLFVLGLLGACTTPTAMLGPAYTLSSTGNVLQAGFSYGTNEMITAYTGKSPIENLKEISSIEKNNTQNIQKKTLESEDFYLLVKSKIEKTSGIFKLSSQ
tara:strand:- start:78 stop:401 length:324 start_codon:yes stop_codon:yes gene_type:complete